MMSGTRTVKYEVDCIYKQHLYNQGFTFCFKGDVTKCDTCPYRHPKEYEIEESWASTEVEDDTLWMSAD